MVVGGGCVVHIRPRAWRIDRPRTKGVGLTNFIFITELSVFFCIRSVKIDFNDFFICKRLRSVIMIYEENR